jgi:glycosyltransferase involved in cell wall biosynthesis
VNLTGDTAAAARVEVCEVEISGPAAPVGGGGDVLLIARLHDHVLGSVLVDATAAADPDLWPAVVREALAPAIEAHLGRDELAVPAASAALPASDPGSACRQERLAAQRCGIDVTVVIATRGRPASLARCLDSVLADRYPRRRVVVVDNAPPDDQTEALVRSRDADEVLYTREDRPGLAAAHNHGLRFVDSPIVAFTDDDVVVDRWWLTSLAAAFCRNQGAAAVTGFIAPYELETPTQLLLERHGAFGKGALRRVYDLYENRPADSLFPFTAGQLGSGANMAFRTDALRDAGGFDPSLGTGTPAKGGDDLAALFSMVAAGHQVVYEPGAMVRHRHHQEPAALARQSFGYGVGLGAFLTGAALAHPRLVLDTARFVPHGVRYAFSGSSERNKGRYDGWPKGLAWRERAGLALGPLAYARSRLATRRWAA